MHRRDPELNSNRRRLRRMLAALAFAVVLPGLAGSAVAADVTVICQAVHVDDDGVRVVVDSACNDGSGLSMTYDDATGLATWSGTHDSGAVLPPRDGPPNHLQGLRPHAEDDAETQIWWLYPLGAAACYANHHATIRHLAGSCSSRGRRVASLNAGYCGMGSSVTCRLP